MIKIGYNMAMSAYSTLIGLVSPFHSKAKKWHDGRKDIFERMKRQISSDNRPLAWFHAASLGEFEQGRPVIEQFRAQHPDFKILLTFFSPSGYEVRKDYKGVDWVYYLPADTPSNVQKFMDIVNPKIAVFIKYEFWLNYLEALHRRGTHTYVISAIFHDKQVFFKPYGARFRKVLGYFEQIFVQNEESRVLLSRFGIENVSVVGDTRFDRVREIARNSSPNDVVAAFAKDSKVFIAGSTWPKDEELILEVMKRHPDLKFIVAPHEIHPDRIDQFIADSGVSAVKYTQIKEGEDLSAKRLLVVDTIGILSSLYRYGTVAYIGGGFGVGIHNTLEAATFGMPIVFGPNYHRFAEAKEMVAQGGAESITTVEELDGWLTTLIGDDALCRRTGQICSDYTSTGVGATDKILKELSKYAK